MRSGDRRCYGWFGAGLLADLTLAVLTATATAIFGLMLRNHLGLLQGEGGKSKHGPIADLGYFLLLVFLSGCVVYANLRPRLGEWDNFKKDQHSYGFPFEAAHSFIVIGIRGVGEPYTTEWQWNYPKLAGDVLFTVLVMGLFCGLMVWLRRRGKRGTQGTGTEDRSSGSSGDAPEWHILKPDCTSCILGANHY